MADQTYVETASAPGAWDAVLAPEQPTTRQQMQDILAAACTRNMPVTAAIVEYRGRVNQVALLRDPSSQHGTPSTEDCSAFVKQLAAAEAWRILADSSAGPLIIVVMLGLREGYDPSATVHPAEVVEEHLDALNVAGYAYSPVHLFSARRLDDGVRVYDEPGVMIGLDSADLAPIADLAHRIRQDRFVVTDYPASRTYALAAREAVDADAMWQHTSGVNP